MNNLKYRFNEKEHLHELLVQRNNGEFEWTALTGTTTVLEVLGKQLTWWASGKAVEQFSGIEDCKVLTKIKNGKATDAEKTKTEKAIIEWLSMHKDISEKEYLELCTNAYSAHNDYKESRAVEGTDMHSELERYIRNQMIIGTMIDRTVYNEKIQPFITWTMRNVKRFLWTELNVFDEDLFIGGIIDAGAELNNGEYVLMDFKSSKEVYFSQLIQCALYGIQLEKNGGYDEKGNKTFELDKPITKFLVFPFGAKNVFPTISDRVDSLKKVAVNCVEIYREKALFENKTN